MGRRGRGRGLLGEKAGVGALRRFNSREGRKKPDRGMAHRQFPRRRKKAFVMEKK